MTGEKENTLSVSNDITLVLRRPGGAAVCSHARLGQPSALGAPMHGAFTGQPGFACFSLCTVAGLYHRRSCSEGVTKSLRLFSADQCGMNCRW